MCDHRRFPAGHLGESCVLKKLDANLAKAIFSIGAVKGFEIGEGFDAAALTGLENNDSFCAGPFGQITKETNHAGGILGGISDGCPIIFRAAFKPTPSIVAPQKTVKRTARPLLSALKAVMIPLSFPGGLW